MDSFWDFLWLLIVAFAFVAYLMVLFSIIGDLFRDHKTSGWIKAVWVLFLVVFPFLTALVYLIARGSSMSQRTSSAIAEARKQQENYIRETAGHSSTQEILNAKALLADGTISQDEFDQLKAKALS